MTDADIEKAAKEECKDYFQDDWHQDTGKAGREMCENIFKAGFAYARSNPPAPMEAREAVEYYVENWARPNPLGCAEKHALKGAFIAGDQNGAAKMLKEICEFINERETTNALVNLIQKRFGGGK